MLLVLEYCTARLAFHIQARTHVECPHFFVSSRGGSSLAKFTPMDQRAPPHPSCERLNLAMKSSVGVKLPARQKRRGKAPSLFTRVAATGDDANAQDGNDRRE
eukprot:1524285-Prymnesium_polylepis.1